MLHSSFAKNTSPSIEIIAILYGRRQTMIKIKEAQMAGVEDRQILKSSEDIDEFFLN